MPSIAVRISDSEKIQLDYLARGDISKYIRSVAFGEAKCRAESIGWLESRVEDLLENHAALLDTVGALAAEVHELKAAPIPQPQPITAPAQDNSRLEGMTLELLLLLRRNVSLTDRRGIQATVESQGLPVWEDSAQPSSFMAARMAEQRPQPTVEKQDPPAKEEQSLGTRVKSWLG